MNNQLKNLRYQIENSPYNKGRRDSLLKALRDLEEAITPMGKVDSEVWGGFLQAARFGEDISYKDRTPVEVWIFKK